MRVLHIGKFYPPFAGGIEHFLADLIEAQQRQVAQTAALVHRHDGGGAEDEPAAGATATAPLVYRAPCYGRLLYAPLSPQFPLWLGRVIRGFQPDILHLHLPNTSAFWALFLPAARRIPWVIHWHADVVASRIDRRLALAYRVYRPLEQRLLAASRAVIATSPAYLDTSAALESWRDKCRVIPLGLNPERIPEPTPLALAEAQRNWGDAPLKVLAVGRMTYYKGHDVLLRAAAAVPELRLIIVGEGEHRPRLEALVRTMGLEDRVALPGFRPKADLYALFATCDLVCLPSLERTEAFGLVLLEAMRFRKPVIASDIPGSGVGWVVRQAGHGRLVRPGDPQALVEALAALTCVRARTRFGQQGTQALYETFHIAHVARQTLLLYEDLCQRGR